MSPVGSASRRRIAEDELLGMALRRDTLEMTYAVILPYVNKLLVQKVCPDQVHVSVIIYVIGKE
jgi:hypothetical protein